MGLSNPAGGAKFLVGYPAGERSCHTGELSTVLASATRPTALRISDKMAGVSDVGQPDVKEVVGKGMFGACVCQGNSAELRGRKGRGWRSVGGGSRKREAVP